MANNYNISELVSAAVDIYIDQGDTYIKHFTVTDNTGTPVDLTGLDITALMTRYAGSGTTYNLVPAVVTAASGTFTLSMADTDSVDLVNNRYVYSVKISDGSNTAKIMHGTVVVTNI